MGILPVSRRFAAIPLWLLAGAGTPLLAAETATQAAAVCEASPPAATDRREHRHRQTFDAVVVTAARPDSALTWVTDPRQPRQPVPAGDGADYLATIPGFSSLRNGGTNADPVLRGMLGSRLNLLTNDGSMPGACPSRMDNPLSYVAPETFDSLIVVKGPQTVLWGPGASAGTVRFDRRTERFGEAGVRARASLLGGNAGRNDQVLDVAGGTPDGYARVSANRSEADDYSDGDGNRVPSAWNKWNADLSLGWTPDDDTLLELTAGAGDGEARYAGRGMDGSQFDRSHYGLRLETSGPGAGIDVLTASLFHNRADHVMDNYSLRDPNPAGSMPMPMASNVERRTHGGRVAADWSGDAWRLTAGIDRHQSRHRTRSAGGRGAYLQVPWTTDARFRNFGVFAEVDWTVSEAGKLIAGSRIDQARAIDRRAAAGMMGMANPTFGMSRREDLPGGFVRYEHGAGDGRWNWYAGLGHVERMPDYWELFSPDSGPAGSRNAFEGVQPERTTQIDVGGQYRGARLDAWISAYRGQVGDYILFEYTSGGMMGPTSAVSNIDARIHGAETGFEYRFADDWRTGGSLAWSWGENRDGGQPLAQMPPLEARWSVTFDNDRWQAGSLLRAVTGQDRVTTGQGNVAGRDLGPSGGFATFAINAGYRFDDHLQLTAGIDNLFDRTYAEHLNLSGSADFGYPADPVRINAPGRTLWLKLDFRHR